MGNDCSQVCQQTFNYEKCIDHNHQVTVSRPPQSTKQQIINEHLKLFQPQYNHTSNKLPTIQENQQDYSNQSSNISQLLRIRSNIKKNLMNDFENDHIIDGYNEKIINTNQYFIGIYHNGKKNGYGIRITFVNDRMISQQIQLEQQLYGIFKDIDTMSIYQQQQQSDHYQLYSNEINSTSRNVHNNPNSISSNNSNRSAVNLAQFENKLKMIENNSSLQSEYGKWVDDELVDLYENQADKQKVVSYLKVHQLNTD